MLQQSHIAIESCVNYHIQKALKNVKLKCENFTLGIEYVNFTSDVEYTKEKTKRQWPQYSKL